MARKKRKAAKRPDVDSSPQLSGGLDSWLLPGLGALALVFAWLAMLGGISDGTLDLRVFFNHDFVRPFIFFGDLFLEDFSVARWRAGRAPYYFPDFFLQWPLFALGVGVVGGLLLFPLAQAAFAAIGWILVCDALYGKSPVRRAAALLLQALILLVSAWRGADLFQAQLSGVLHGGAWAALPWLLWLSLRTMSPVWENEKEGGLRSVFAAWLVVLLAAVTVSDLVIVVWFAVPAAAAIIPLTWTGKASRRGCFLFVAALVAGCVGGRIFHLLIPAIDPGGIPSRDLSVFFPALAAIGTTFADAFVRHPAEMTVWLAFAAVALWRAAAVLFPEFGRRLPDALALPPARRHHFLALFVPAAMTIPLLTMAATGSVDFNFLHRRAAENPSQAWALGAAGLRFALPALFLPLFAGWAISVFSRGGIPRAKMVAAAACALVFCAAVPKLARINPLALDPFATPFQKCFAENARRLEWSGGISAFTPLTLMLIANPDAGVERMLPVGTFRRPEKGQSFMVTDLLSYSANRISGEFQFVAANLHEGRAFMGLSPPHAGERGCPAAECADGADNFTLDMAAARAAFGEPKKVVICEGIPLMHYDPPLKFDFSRLDNPHLSLVARW